MYRLYFMKTIFTILLIVATSAFGADTDPYSIFKAKLTEAIAKKDLKLLDQLFYVKGASEYQIDMAVYSYEYDWLNKSYAFDKIEFISPGDPSYSEVAMQAMLKPQTMNGHTYVPNIKPAKFCSVTFKSKDGKGSMGTLSPIGVAPDGTVKFVLVEKVDVQ